MRAAGRTTCCERPTPTRCPEPDIGPRLEYPELEMEAIWAIDVVDFPAFILADDKGHDFYQKLM